MKSLLYTKILDFSILVPIFATNYLDMTNILTEIITKSNKTRGEVADGLGITRQGLHYKLQRPKGWTVDELQRFAKFFGRSPRNLFTLIMNN